MGRKPKQIELNDPTPGLVWEYIRQFEDSERYNLADQAIIKLFRLIPHNKDLEDILLKLSVINNLYSTRILATFELARHIQRLNIDPELAVHSTEIVNRIADFSVSGKRIYVFSFATKYCNWHDQEHYPILDSFVEKLIIAYRNRDEFAIFEKKELQNYTRFKEILEIFRQHYRLTAFGFKKLDKYLWLYGKEKFANNRVQ